MPDANVHFRVFLRERAELREALRAPRAIVREASRLDAVLPTAMLGSIVRTHGLAAAVAGLPAPVGAVVEIERLATQPVEAEVIGFRGGETIVYASVSPSDQLRSMHRLVWDAMVRVASGRGAAYAPETWVPHVALAAGPVPDDAVGDVTALLERHDASAWVIKVNNICYVPDVDDGTVDWLRFDFK